MKPVKVWLENECHGKVLVCSKGNCGVCEDTWSPKQSEMLCKSLGCGEPIKETYRGVKTTPGVSVASVHCSQAAENFSQCNFVKLDPALCQSAAYVACTGNDTIHNSTQ